MRLIKYMYTVCYKIIDKDVKIYKNVSSPYLLKKLLSKISHSQNVKLVDFQRVY